MSVAASSTSPPSSSSSPSQSPQSRVPPRPPPKIGVLALQGAFEEHQACLEALGCVTVQVKTAAQLHDLDAIVFPGGESTAMGLIGSSHNGDNLWDALKSFIRSGRPTWGTCAGLILLAERCVGTSAVIEDGQSLIGGMDVLVCRNYFGSQISSFEVSTPCPPGFESLPGRDHAYPAVFIRAPAILAAGEDVEVLGRVVATPCRQAAAVLRELDAKIERGEEVITMGVVDSLHDRIGGGEEVKKEGSCVIPSFTSSCSSSEMVRTNNLDFANDEEEKKETNLSDDDTSGAVTRGRGRCSDKAMTLPGAAEGTDAREVICAVRKGNVLCTAFHPEIADDLRWHEYFVDMVNGARGG